MANTKIESDKIQTNQNSGSSFVNLKNEGLVIGTNQDTIPVKVNTGEQSITLLNGSGQTYLNNVYVSGINESVNTLLKNFDQLKQNINRITTMYFAAYAWSGSVNYPWQQGFSDSGATCPVSGRYKLKIYKRKGADFNVYFAGLGPFRCSSDTEINLNKDAILSMKLANFNRETTSRWGSAIYSSKYEAFASLTFLR